MAPLDYGKILEQAIFLEIKCYLDYTFQKKKFEYWRFTSQFEVDFLIYKNLQDMVGIEVKSSQNLSRRDYRGFFALEEEFPLKRKFVICHTDTPRKTSENIEILPVQYFLENLWKGKII